MAEIERRNVQKVRGEVENQLHADTASGRLLIRDGKNQNWIELGKLDKSFFGIEPEDINAVRNTGTIGAFHAGNAADLPPVAGMRDIFYALDEKKIYFYSGTAWELVASLDATDLYGSEKVVTADDISSTGEANKLVRLDSSGTIHADLDGKLATARKIAITGDAEGSVYFDGSEDATINLSITNPVAEATSAVSDGAGNVISETYATKAALSSFVTTTELATTLEDYATTSGASAELIFREDITALFNQGAQGEDLPSVWDGVKRATDDDILNLFGREA